MSADTPPEPPGYPVVGHSLRWMRDPFSVGSWAQDAVGGVASLRLLNTDLVVVTDPDPIGEVLVEKRDRIPKSDQYTVAFGDGLASVSGEEWKRQRDAISTFFRPSRIDGYDDAIVSLTESRSDGWTDGERVPVFEEMKSLTLEVLFETLFDHPIDPDGADADLRRAVDDLDQWFKPTSWVLPEWVPTPARRRFRTASARIDDIAAELLRDAAPDGDGMLAALRRFSNRGDAGLAESEIRSQLRTLLFAGHETTASTLSFALHLLGEHPDVASRLHAELDAVLDGAPPRADHLDSLRVTDNVVRETLRLYPPPFRIPRMAADDVEIGGYTVEAGTDILAFTAVPHRDERFWDAPTEFRPSRWNDLDPGGLGYRYLPFGAGPRACIGKRMALLETRLVLASLCRAYRFEPDSDLRLSARVAATPEGALPMTVRRR